MPKHTDDMFIEVREPKPTQAPDNDFYQIFEEVAKIVQSGIIQEQEPGSPKAPETADEIRKLLPTLKITEDWGKVGNRDREVIESFTASLGGENTSVEQKIQLMNQVIEGQSPNVSDISDVLTVMMVVEVLSSILGEFTESAGGFIFEGFLAGLFGGKSVQITQPSDITAATGETVSAAGKPITDVVLSGKHYSLKLLGPGTAVMGSFKNMVDHFVEIDSITYLDARRAGSNLEFSEFDITLPTFLQTFYYPLVRYQKKTAVVDTPRKLQNALNKLGDKVFQVRLSKRLNRVTNIKPEQFEELLAMQNLAEYGPFEVQYSDEKFGGKVKQYFGSARIFNDVQAAVESKDNAAILQALRETPAYKRPEQFNLTRSQTEKIDSYRELGTLQLGDDALKKTWMAYGERLMQTIGPVYSSLNNFTNNINRYFLSAPTEGESRTEYGRQAIRDATVLDQATDKAVGELNKS